MLVTLNRRLFNFSSFQWETIFYQSLLTESLPVASSGYIKGTFITRKGAKGFLPFCYD